MIAYKFLLQGRVSPFSGVTWPAENWIEADGTLVRCRSGIHACRVRDLAYWLTDELWRVELGGEVIEYEFKVVSRRAKLVGRIDAWDVGTRQDFIRMCLHRVVEHAVAEAAESSADAKAATLFAASAHGELDALQKAARDLEATLPDDARAAKRLAGFVQDAVDWVELPPAALAYVAAHAADSRSRVSQDDPFEAERSLQSAWLAERLGLD